MWFPIHVCGWFRTTTPQKIDWPPIWHHAWQIEMSPVVAHFNSPVRFKADLSVCVIDRLWMEDMILKWTVKADGSGPGALCGPGEWICKWMLSDHFAKPSPVLLTIMHFDDHPFMGFPPSKFNNHFYYLMRCVNTVYMCGVLSWWRLLVAETSMENVF